MIAQKPWRAQSTVCAYLESLKKLFSITTMKQRHKNGNQIFYAYDFSS
ncbi:hypothetical protein V3C99_012480 [Haemonchus contortus]